MKKTILTVGMLAALSTSALATAGDFYVGGDIGSARESGMTGMNKVTDTAFSLVGGYQYNKNLGIEANYTDFGTLTDLTGVSAKTTQYGLSAVGAIGVTDTIGLYAKVGYGSAKTTANVGVSDTRTDINYGLGATYAVNSAIDVRASWTHTPIGKGVNIVKASEDVYALGVVYKFH